MSRFSIVVPAYNAQSTLAETLDAITAQTFTDWECVIVDDGSTDETRSLAESYSTADPRFRVLSQENRGTGGAYNTGVGAASGDWVSICSADDLLLPEHLDMFDQAISNHPGYDILSCNGYFETVDGARRLVYARPDDQHSRSWSLEDVLERCFFSVGACYRRSLFDTVGGYEEDAYGEDYDFWLRAMASGAKHLYVPAATAVHRLSPTQKSANLVRAFESDVRSISALLHSGKLTGIQRKAARKAIRARKRQVSETVYPGRLDHRVRRRLSSLLSRTNG